MIEWVVEKVSGVFLWVIVVVVLFLFGMVDGDCIEDFERMLDYLLMELEKFYEKIVGGIKF